MSNSHVVIIPGAWMSPLYFDTVKSKLEFLGYNVHVRQMPAVGAADPPQDLSRDVAAARSLVEDAIGDGNDVVVIAHSWGGIVASTGLTGLGKKERAAEGKKGGITRVGYIAAFLVPEGTSLIDAVGGTVPAAFDVKGPYVYAKDPSAIYNDLSASEQQFFYSKHQSHSFATFTTKTTAASWRQIPTSYLLCEDDGGLPALAQEAMIKGVQDAGGDIEVRRMKVGHFPFLSQPDETVKWIETVGKASTRA